jgi:hypothetical protein
MPDEPTIPPAASLTASSSFTVGGPVSPAVHLKGEGRLSIGTIRAAVQELHDSSHYELQERWNTWNQVNYLRVPAVRGNEVAALADEADKSRMTSLAKLIRAGAKFGAMTIIAAIISGPVNNTESDLFGWTPPSVTVVRQMSPAQMDELARQIEHKLQQREQDQGGGHELPTPPGQRSPGNSPRPEIR